MLPPRHDQGAVMKWQMIAAICSSACLLAGCGPSIEAWVDPAERAVANGDTAGGIAIYEDALQTFSDDPTIRTGMAGLMLSDGVRLVDAGEPALAADSD